MAKFGLNLQLEEYPIDLALKTAKLAENLKLEAVFVNDEAAAAPTSRQNLTTKRGKTPPTH
jgi:hypothetical protein